MLYYKLLCSGMLLGGVTKRTRFDPSKLCYCSIYPPFYIHLMSDSWFCNRCLKLWFLFQAVRVEHCERVQVITAAKRICIANCRECIFFLGVNQQPLILGDNHKLQVSNFYVYLFVIWKLPFQVNPINTISSFFLKPIFDLFQIILFNISSTFAWPCCSTNIRI